MTKKVARIKRKFLRNIFGLFSFTTALFVFQACYGVPHDFDILPCGCYIEGTVKTADSNSPLNNVNISINGERLANTDSNGYFNLCVERSDKYRLKAIGGDRSRDGSNSTKDTTLTSFSENDYFHIDLVLGEN